MDYNALAELLFPDVTNSPDYYESLYPQRELPEGAKVTRFAPSPTGFVHFGGLFPVLINAFAIPGVIILCGGAEGFDSTMIAYWTFFGSLCATQTLWVYGLGIPLYVTVYKLRKKGVAVFSDGKKI